MLGKVRKRSKSSTFWNTETPKLVKIIYNNFKSFPDLGSSRLNWYTNSVKFKTTWQRKNTKAMMQIWKDRVGEPKVLLGRKSFWKKALGWYRKKRLKEPKVWFYLIILFTFVSIFFHIYLLTNWFICCV